MRLNIIFSALVLAATPVFMGFLANARDAETAEIPVVETEPELILPTEEDYQLVFARPSMPDPILEAYRDPGFHEEVIAFFGGIVNSDQLAMTMLDNASRFNISPSLAFALCWEESRYNPRAVNRQNLNKTVDRGLFQLNNVSFPQLGEEQFFDPQVNVYYGMAHLRWCLDKGGSEVAGLAMYNAGPNRVQGTGAPIRTLNYISRILDLQQRIDQCFNAYLGPALNVALLPAYPAYP